MEFFYVLLTTFFVIMLIITALSFGFALLIWFAIAGTIFAMYVILRDRIQRWRFLYNARHGTPRRDKPPIIEVEYEEIEDDDIL